MSSSKDKQQKQQEKFQAILSGLLREEDNKYCADCEAKAPPVGFVEFGRFSMYSLCWYTS